MRSHRPKSAPWSSRNNDLVAMLTSLDKFDHAAVVGSCAPRPRSLSHYRQNATAMHFDTSRTERTPARVAFRDLAAGTAALGLPSATGYAEKPLILSRCAPLGLGDSVISAQARHGAPGRSNVVLDLPTIVADFPTAAVVSALAVLARFALALRRVASFFRGAFPGVVRCKRLLRKGANRLQLLQEFRIEILPEEG